MSPKRDQSPNSRILQDRHTALVLAISLVLRILVARHALSSFGATWFYTRGSEMGYIADSLMRGRGFSSPFGYETGPTAIIAPGYPLFTALIFHLFGVYSTLSAWVLILVNISLNVLCVWLVLALSRLVASERAALGSGLFWATFPPLLWMPTIFWETSFSCAFLLAPILLICTRLKDQRSVPWIPLGVLVGAASLFNPMLGVPLSLLLIAACLLGRMSASRLALSFALGCSLYIAWPIRNWMTFGCWIPARTTLGLELWMGNHQGSDGTLQESLFPTYNASERSSYVRSGEVGYMQGKSRAATSFIRDHPAHFMLLSTRRTLRFWFGTGNKHGSPWYPWNATLTTCMGIFGLCTLLRSEERRLGWILLISLLLIPLPYCLTHAEFRYRLLLDPLLTALSARALDRLFGLTRTVQQQIRGGARTAAPPLTLELES